MQTEGPLLVLAGAGSGKTRVIAHRVVHLLEQATCRRAAILAVTFTNKAAAEMKERVVELAAGAAEARRVTVSTFHAFGVRSCCASSTQLGLPAKFTILDAGDQAALVKRLLRELKIDDERFDVSRGAGGHLALRRTGCAGARPGARRRDDEYELVRAARLAEVRAAACGAMGAVDFDDSSLLPVRLLADATPRCCERWQDALRYLLVDEYQDTNARAARAAGAARRRPRATSRRSATTTRASTRGAARDVRQHPGVRAALPGR